MRVLIAAELQPLLPSDPLPGYGVEWIPSQEPTPRGDYVAIIPLLSRPIGEGELDGLPNLRVLAQCAVGYDNIDLAAAARRGIPVTNTPDVLTESTADLAWTLILSVARRTKEAQEVLYQDSWTGWSPTQLLGLELNGSTLGIVGAGRIGQAVGRRAVGFGMAVLYSDSEGRPEFEEGVGASRRDLFALLAESDVVSVHVPSTNETRGLFDAVRFSSMKPGALFINTARGDLVDEEALREALDLGRLGGAGLDVFSREPDVPRGLVQHPKVVALPHIGSATTVTRRAMAELAVENAAAVLDGRPPVTPVEL
ncbi:MAG: D-glycerate dehydrogenase [Gemmatimonadetes bacterium]|nr:D-glycerate dehydrogenase [Gemmatimonadota bacterium]NNM06525.1 D-glycerate dehydrogenase [Gemmatimonadota bacterium]